MKVVFHYFTGPGLRARLDEAARGELVIDDCAESNDGRFAELMAEAVVLWHVLRPVTPEVIDGAPSLRLIQKIGVGVNTIDLGAAEAREIAVCNLPGTNSRAVAEHALLLMLGALRRSSTYDRATRAGRGWSLGGEIPDTLGELGGRTVGLIGYGAVPRILAPILEALGARVLYTARRPHDDAVGAWRELPELLAESDVVSLHVPQTPETERLINAETLAWMKPGAVLVNTARGGLVDEPALVAALGSGQLRAAGLDVFAEEPVDPANPLLALENVILAPHIAWLTPETFERSFAVAAENCRRLRDGRSLLNRVI
ncbi:MAG: 2-hydroxyacid dehydrogenase [Actinomycetia bacterium]|nr:2-hydroxyacid dehydrogenase [Actinomycetes bacterium]